MRRYALRDVLVSDTRGQQSFVQGRRRRGGLPKIRGGGSSDIIGSKKGRHEYSIEGGHGVKNLEGEDGKGGDGEEIEDGNGKGVGGGGDDIPPLIQGSAFPRQHQRILETDEENDEDLNSYTPSRPFRVPITPVKPRDSQTFFQNSDSLNVGMGYYEKAEQGVLPPTPGRGVIDPFGLRRGFGRRVKTPPIDLRAIEELGERKKWEAEEDERMALGMRMRGMSSSPTPMGDASGSSDGREVRSEAGGVVGREDKGNGEDEYFSDGENEVVVNEDGEVNRGRSSYLPSRERRIVLGELKEDDPRLGGLGLDYLD